MSKLNYILSFLILLVTSCGGGDSPKSVAEQMTLLIEEKIDDVIWTINSCWQSDSNELPDFMEEDTNLGAHKQAVTKNMLDFAM